ncbi:MAG: leucine-rich repeat protein [Oscillibacter sp.]|nr:leucine-rich repeat protein [Oscillibacter sp.]
MEPYDGQEPYIFISYARKDKERVTPFLDALSGAAYRVWYDAGIQAGDEWLKTLEEKVANCAVFCPIFSHAFNDSYYCYRETSYACWRNRKIVPLYLEEVTESLRLLFRLLNSFQHLRMYDCTPTQFAERVERARVFQSCKVPPEPRKASTKWHKVEQIQWRFDADGVLRIANNKDSRSALGSIPSYEYNPGNGGNTAPWAPYREKILSVEIADDIDVIGNRAFLNYTRLTKVLIGNSVLALGSHAFRNCPSLTDVHIPDSVTKIGDYAFYGCKSMTKVLFGNSVTRIGEYAFDGCHNLTNVRIPDSVTAICIGAFWHCTNLKSVDIPAEAEVASGAFSYYTSVIRRPPRRDAP